MKYIILSFGIFFSITINGQDITIKKNSGGIFSLGGRSTISFFNDGAWQNAGTGVGGQFRIQLDDRVNTEWFFDYISGHVGEKVNRTDYHIGWSVLFYLKKGTNEKLPLFQPYILAGHCFDYSYLEENLNRSNNIERWSSAVQAGGGLHMNITSRLDLSFITQYMIHLGKDVHAHEENNQVMFESHKGLNLEGHILSTFSINYKIANLW